MTNIVLMSSIEKDDYGRITFENENLMDYLLSEVVW